MGFLHIFETPLCITPSKIFDCVADPAGSRMGAARAGSRTPQRVAAAERRQDPASDGVACGDQFRWAE